MLSHYPARDSSDSRSLGWEQWTTPVLSHAHKDYFWLKQNFHQILQAPLDQLDHTFGGTEQLISTLVRSTWSER